jgi:thiol-disulfide isomerase/thioredoxin
MLNLSYTEFSDLYTAIYPGRALMTSSARFEAVRLMPMGVRFFSASGTTSLRSDSGTVRVFPLLRPVVAILLAFLLSFSATGARQTVVDLRGSADKVLVEGRGKVLVFVFVRTDCPISNRYAPVIHQIQKQFGQAAIFRLVFPDKNEPADKIRKYLREYGYDILAIRDLDHALAKRTMARVTPEAAVFNAQAELVYHGRIDNLYERIGQARRAATTHELADAIQAAARGASPPVASVDGVGCFIADLE